MLLPYDSHTLYGSVVHHKLLWVIVLLQLWQDMSLAMPMHTANLRCLVT